MLGKCLLEIVRGEFGVGIGGWWICGGIGRVGVGLFVECDDFFW